MYDVSGKRAIITGGAQGFGKQFARRLLQKGCRVCITDIDENKGQEAKKEFQEQFGIKENRYTVYIIQTFQYWFVFLSQKYRVIIVCVLVFISSNKSLGHKL
jgi:NAD(P)-dependent dehydrogenase (short-subunit alcohol dehydrogenase family)